MSRKAYYAQYRVQHRNRLNEQKRREYRRNASTYAARDARRRTLKMARTPLWVRDQPDLFKPIYAQRDRCCLKFGRPFEVDHIVPLRGETVCGLHVPENLQVLTREENRGKTNTFDDWSDFPIPLEERAAVLCECKRLHIPYDERKRGRRSAQK